MTDSPKQNEQQLPQLKQAERFAGDGGIDAALKLIVEVTAATTTATDARSLSVLLLEAMCRLTQSEVGQVWEPDESQAAVVCRPDIFLATRDVPEFRQASLAATFKTGIGLPGRVFQSGKPAWIDLAKDHNFPRLEVALKEGLRAGLALPIKNGDAVVAVYEFFSTRLKQPDEHFLEAVAELSSQLSVILERMRSVAALSESQTRFDSFMNNSPAVAFMKDENGCYVYVNEVHERIFRLQKSDIIGKDDFAYLPREIAEEVRENDAMVLAKDEPVELIETVPTPDGVCRHWLVFKFPFRDREERRYVGGVAIDITERRQAEQALKRAHDELESKVTERTQELAEVSIFFNLSVDIFFIGNFDGVVLRANPAVEKVLGFKIDEVIGQLVFDLGHPDEVQASKAQIERLASGEDVKDFEARARCKDGSYKWILWSATPVVGQDLFYAVGHDITGRRQIEDELRESEKMHTQILDAVADMILCKDTQSRIIYANKAFRDFYGMSMDKLQGIIDADFNQPGFTAQYLRDDRYVTQTGQTLNIPQEPVTRHDGQVLVFHTIKSPVFGADGNVVQSVGVSRDITDSKLQEEKIRRLNEDLEHQVTELAKINQELESLTRKLESSRDQALEASKLKSEFVANISHEIRTPITGVIGMTELLIDTELNQEQRGFAGAVKESAESLLTIINDILDFSKMEAGKVNLEIIDFSPLSLVESSAQLLAATAREKKLSLMTFVDPQLPPLLMGDPVRLRQVLLNLTSNAVKFTDGGEVVVRAEIVRSETDRITTRFSVRDTGIGLTEAARKRLFQPFAQADGSTTRKYGGTGLGLSICKRLVELMGGEIGVESTRGKGSTFWFTVDLARADLPSEDTSTLLAATAANLNDLRILVVADNDAAADILGNYLNAAGIEHELVESAHEALAKIRADSTGSHPFDLAIVDIHDASAEGYPLARTIRLEPGLMRTRLILLTPFEGRGKTDQLVREGFSAFLSKPVRQLQLMEAIARVMNRDAAHSTLTSTPAEIKPAPHAHVIKPGGKGPLVLVAEDNPVLQELAVWQLKKLGLSAQSVANGKEVVQALANTDYALILMDCQMPEMDGFEATLAIRKEETDTGKHTPIVAMTASAMQGDRENCLTAGMDDYLSKPVSLEQLKAVLDRWLPKTSATATEITVKDTAIVPLEGRAITGALDIERLEAMYGPESLKEILHLFMRETTHLLGELEHAIKHQDHRGLGTVAHQLKGLCAVMSAVQMERLSLELEHCTKERDWSLAGEKYEDLQDAFSTVSGIIRTLI